MRKKLIILFIITGLGYQAIPQVFVPVNFTQPPALTAAAGTDTLVCTGHPVILGGSPTASGGSQSYLYMWSPPDGLDNPTAANPVATLTESKSYMLSVSDGHGCIAISFVSVFINPCLGIPDNRWEETLKVYPNPSDGQVRINGLLALGSRLTRLEILNQLGQVVFNRAGFADSFQDEIQFDTGIREPGVYILKLAFDDRVISQRLIIR